MRKYHAMLQTKLFIPSAIKIQMNLVHIFLYKQGITENFYNFDKVSYF